MDPCAGFIEIRLQYLLRGILIDQGFLLPAVYPFIIQC